MKGRWITPALLTISLAAPGAFFSLPAQAATPGHGAAAMQDRDDWQRPPDAYNDVQRQGFHDGVEGARKDYENHRQPSPENRDEYRHPHVPRGMRRAYREAFRSGYESGMHHLMGDRYRDHHHDDDHPGL